MKLNRLAPLLVNLTPQQWAETARRFEVIDRFRKLTRPTTSDAINAARELGLRRSGFYKLLRVLNESRLPVDATERGRPRTTPQQVAQLIDLAAERMGRSATAAQIKREVERLCLAEALEPPGLAAIKTRLDAKPVTPDVAATLRRQCDLVLDASPLPFYVGGEQESGQATLSALLLASTGRILAHRLSIGQPDAETWRDLIDDMVPLPRTGRARVLIKTAGITPPSAEIQRDMKDYGIDYHERLSRRLRPGGALRAVFGRHIGRVRLLELPWHNLEHPMEPIPPDLASAAIDLLIERRNAELPGDAAES